MKDLWTLLSRGSDLFEELFTESTNSDGEGRASCTTSEMDAPPKWKPSLLKRRFVFTSVGTAFSFSAKVS